MIEELSHFTINFLNLPFNSISGHTDKDLSDDEWRRAVADHLRNLSEWDSPVRFKIADRLEKCHKIGVKHKCPNDDYYAIMPYRCELRICPKCTQKQRAQIWNEYHDLPNRINRKKEASFYFLTLTLKYNRANPFYDLRHRVNLILNKSRDFMHHFWQKEIETGWFGALSSLEITSKGYVHMHSLLYSSHYPDIVERSNYWKKLTGGECPEYESYRNQLIQIQKTDFNRGLNDILKYITKPANYSPYMAARVVYALYNRRRIYTMGQFYNMGDVIRDRVHMHCPICGTLLRRELGYVDNYDCLSYYDRSPPCGRPNMVTTYGSLSVDDIVKGLEIFYNWQFKQIEKEQKHQETI